MPIKGTFKNQSQISCLTKYRKKLFTSTDTEKHFMIIQSIPICNKNYQQTKIRRELPQSIKDICESPKASRAYRMVNI